MAASQERIARACAAMKNLYGTRVTAARNAVEQLLKIYNKKWEFIEDNNYNVVFEYTQEIIKDQEDNKNAKFKRIEPENELDQVPEFPLEGCLRRHNQPSSVKGSRASNYLNARNKAKQYDQNSKLQDQVIELCSDDDDQTDIPTKRYRRETKEESVKPCKRPKTSNTGTVKDKDSEADDLQIQVYDQSGKFRNIESPFYFDDELTEISVKRHEIKDLAKRAALLTDNVSSKDQISQPLHESISVKHPNAVIRQDRPEISCEYGSSSGKNTNVKVKGLKSKPLNVRGACDHNSETSKFDIASSDNGIVKISLLYNASRKANLDMPNLIAVMKKIENKYRKIYGITDPDFSIMKLMKEICNSFWEIAAGYGNCERVTEISNTCNNSGGHDLVNTKDACQDSSRMQPNNTKDTALTPNNDRNNENFCGQTEEIVTELISSEPSNSSRLKAVMNHRNHDLIDISRGEEGVKIPLLNDNGATELPKFFYISKNIAFKDAYVNFSLARISDDNCCSQCVGDCLSSELPCACAGETRGEFAYTPDGLVKETFLNEAIIMSRKPKRQHFYYCENCPLENNPLEKCKRKRPCKGHLMRKFIKECWNKCGCNKKCGNRVVQRGITASLQVNFSFFCSSW
ncbi:hypothetical protein DITRI_Ditri08aG0141200 [Diplodiscus trichospermus]